MIDMGAALIRYGHASCQVRVDDRRGASFLIFSSAPRRQFCISSTLVWIHLHLLMAKEGIVELFQPERGRLRIDSSGESIIARSKKQLKIGHPVKS